MLPGDKVYLMNTAQQLEMIAAAVERAEPAARCQIDTWGCQINVSFDTRPDVEIALLTPWAQKEVRSGAINQDTLSDLLFSIRTIANYEPENYR